jgi:hypothetical protein
VSDALELLGFRNADALELLGSRNAGEIKQAAWLIWEHEPILPSEEKRKLSRAIKALGKARDGVKGTYLDDPLPEVLEKRRRLYEAEIKAINVKKKSGGEIKSRMMMDVAAWEACGFLLERDIEPTLTKDGKYFKLTALLYKMATGEKRDPARACTAVIKERRQNQKQVEEEWAKFDRKDFDC